MFTYVGINFTKYHCLLITYFIKEGVYNFTVNEYCESYNVPSIQYNDVI